MPHPAPEPAPDPPRGPPDPPDLAAVVAALVARLRDAGVAVDLRAAGHCADALARLGPTGTTTDLRRAYWTARITLVRDVADLAAFDAVFAAVFGAGPDLPVGAPDELPVLPTAARAHRPVAQPSAVAATEQALPWATRPRDVTAAPGGDPGAGGVPVPAVAPSLRPAARSAALGPLDPHEAERLGAGLRAAMQGWPSRRTRRTERAARGRIALRRTAGSWRRTGGEPLRLARERPRRRRRRLVVLCDTSESMRPHVTALLHLLRAATVEGEGETFAFGTRVTRLTPVLARRAPEDAVSQATAAVTDLFGGTRIAGSLRQLLGSHHGELLRGAVVVVVSDGWDADPPEETGRQVARLARRAHRVVWLNPRAGAPGYRPLAGGMAAALPHCDALLPAGSGDELRAAVGSLTAVVTGVSSRASRRPRDGSA